MARKRPEQKAETRRAILQAAAFCFSRDGFERATLQRIATEAGLTVPTLYNYFDGKQALLGALVEELIEETAQLFDVMLPRGLTFPQKLELLIAHQFRWVEERRHAFQFFQSFKPPVPDGTDESTRAQHVSRMERWLTEHAASDDLRIDGASTATVIDACANAFFRSWVADGAESGGLVALAPFVCDVVLHGVGTGTKPTD